VVAALIGLIANPGHAATTGKSITIGESNDEAQRQELLGYFGAEPDDKVEIVGVEETEKAMAKVIPAFNLTTAFYSTALTCRDLGEGIDVTAINITRITPAMYAMALVTAGVGDAELIVASPANAPAEGMTALAGIFQSWQSNPCASSNTTKARQGIALRQLVLAIDLGTVILTDTAFADDFVIDVQQKVVIDGATSSDEIAGIVAEQEGAYGFTVPEAQRDALITLMVDLQELEIDWSTFSAGWTISIDAGKIVMRGDGVAIANAQASATAEAAKEQTATARERKRAMQTAVAAVKQTEAAAVQQTAEAGAQQIAVAAEQTAKAGETSAGQTRTAGDDLTATARAVPTATASPTPVAAAGKITTAIAPNLSVEVGGQPTEYRVIDAATITRDDRQVSLLDLKSGDAVAL